jgi:hypothetical protein
MPSYPNTLNFTGLDPTAIPANSQNVICLPESGRNANPQDISRIRVETGMAGAYLNCAKSFLKFTVVNTTVYNQINPTDNNWTAKATSPLILDLSAFSCIKKIEWYSSSNLLESIDNYNVLAGIMVDCQMSSEAVHTSGDILGMSGDGLVSSNFFNMMRGASSYIRGGNNPVYPFWTNALAWTDANTNTFSGLNIIANNGNGGGAVGTITQNRVISVTDLPAGANYPAGDRGNQTLVGPPQSDTPFGWNNLGFNILTGFLDANAGIETYSNQLASMYSHQGAQGISTRICRLGPQIPYGSELTVCLPLLSMFGTLGCRMVPLHALSSPLMLHVYWESLANATCLQWTPGHYDISLANGGVAPPDGTQAPALVGAGAGDLPRINGSSTTMTWGMAFRDVEYHANIVTISGEAQAQIDMMTQGIYSISTSSYRHYSNRIPAGSSVNEILIPARFSSLKSLYSCMRPEVNNGLGTAFTISDRIKNWMTDTQLRIGSSLFPAQPCKMKNNFYLTAGADRPACENSGSAPQAYSLLLNALGTSLNSLNIPCNMDSAVYASNVRTAPSDVLRGDGPYYIGLARGSQAGFVLGYDLDSFGPSDTCSGPLNSGLNTLGVSIFLLLSCDARALSSTAISAVGFDNAMVQACQLDSFAHFDVVLTIQGGAAEVRF